MNIKKLNEIFAAHKLWLNYQPEGNRANLTGAYLQGANLADANLLEVCLEGANLSGANLQNANLASANLRKACLEGANLSGANLQNANLADANLAGADLRYANLQNANLWGAKLQKTDLRVADLRCADLEYANLEGASLEGANLWGTDLRGAILLNAIVLLTVPVLKNIDAQIRDALNLPPNGLRMKGFWHQCETTHCRGGWAIYLAGEAGKALEAQTSSYLAARLIYEASRPGIPAPDFFASDDAAMNDINRCAERYL